MKKAHTRAFTRRDIDVIARKNPAGLSVEQIIGMLGTHGLHLTAPTFHKYVQLGLLPQSRRIGSRGRHRGSHGLYPVTTLLLVVRIRQLLPSATLKQIRDRLAFELRMSEAQRAEAEVFGLLQQMVTRASGHSAAEHERLKQTSAALRHRLLVLHRTLTAAINAQYAYAPAARAA